MTVAVGVAFIVAVAEVYYGGISENPDYPFEIERIRENILVPFILLISYIAAVIVGAVLSAVYPVAEKKTAYKNSAKNLATLKSRIPTAGGEEYAKAKKELSKYEKIRIAVWGVTFAFFLAAAIFIFVYAFNITNYHGGEFKRDILALVRHVLSWTAAGLIMGIIAVVSEELIIKREIKAAKDAIVSGDKTALPEKKEIKKKTVIASTVTAGVVIGIAILAYTLAPVIVKGTLTLPQSGIYAVVFAVTAVIAASFSAYGTLKSYIPEKAQKIILLVSRIAVGVIAITFIFVGAFNGGAHEVFVKATQICRECIGIA